MSVSTKTNRLHHLENRLAGIIERSLSSDELMLRLLYANVVTSLEVYLYGLTTDLIQSNSSLLLNVARSEKFKARKLPIYFALQNDLTQYFLQLVSEINFHNLSDIEPLFREAFDVKIPLNDEVLQAIKVRHDIVHRDGFSKAGDPVNIEPSTLKKTVHAVSELVKSVDRQVVERYAALVDA